MVKFKKTTLSVLSVGLAACLSTSIAAMAITGNGQGMGVSSANGDTISRLDGSIDNHTADFFDSNVVYRLSDNVSDNQEISVILSLNTQSTLDAYLEGGSKGEFSDYLATSSAKKLVKANRAAGEELRKTIDKAKISYKMGVSYENVISGFEVTLRAKDYYKLVDAVSGKATPIVGEVYAPALAEVVTNDVDVYPTGIFDSSSCEYKGDGVVVAVLDTGLDYTHTAFSTKNFKTTNARFTLENVSDKLNTLSAATTTSNLKAEDVYVSEKVPYAYDYADKDPDVFPLNSEHGTHVAGVIAGKDDTITGVAPNAQLAIMKVFSDSEASARSSWILAGVDDCVALGVDVINMSLGTAAGFTTQDDNEKLQEIYNSVKKAGISLIAAAGNENNAVQGSDKNGSNPLTRNPDSGVVGSPSTYEASLSVASVGGVKTPYFVYNDDIIYFNEASDSTAKPKHFVDDVLAAVGAAESYDFEYVTISGVGRRSDYTESREYYQNKIVLVKRGDTTFEEKVDIALRIMKAAGIIIYNNVSGSISMSVGSVKGAVCSISQDEGEKLAAAKTGTIKISTSQVAGPFMSDFSSWGPTSDLRIKPEITAHGGEILSAVPGQAYDRLSGTSMAAPNMAGAAALIRQYVKANPEAFKLRAESSDNNDYAIDVTKRVNQLAMSTADIVRNKNGLAYAVRKQGAGLVSIGKATTAEAYISTFQNGEEMDKSKLELGDDKNKTGVYTMTFDINNVTGSSVSYNIGSIVMTEGVSSTLTSHGDTTVTTDGYLLSPATSIVSVQGGTNSGSVVTVSANSSAKVTVKITLSEEDKTYLNDSFENGMYVEGFITLSATNGTKVDLNVPFLAFYGDWTEAPIFDEEYYDTNADEINNGIDPEDKLMADAYATRVIGGYYSDYIAPLGTYPFVQDPSASKIAASKDHIALSNYENDESSTLNKINSIAAGLLRNVKEWKLTIVEESTGKEIWTKEGRNQRKSLTSGNTIYQSNMEVNFSVLEHNLKNNTKYTVTVETFIDGDKSEQKNKRNTFTFPLYIDFEAPIVTGVDYRTEYDQTTKQTHLYADVNIYDNHYAMGVSFGQIVASTEPNYVYSMSSFGKYVTPVYSSFNSTSKVTIELTDYVKLIKNNSIGLGSNGGPVSNNSFVATCYDYAMNAATYEIRLPDEVLAMYFKETEVKLNPNETLDLTTVLDVFPADTWLQILDFKSDNEAAVGVVNQTAIAKPTGVGQTATITATGKDANGKTIQKSIQIYVRRPNDDGYREYDAPLVNKASISKYYTEKAFYDVSSTDREIGVTDGTYSFGKDYTLSMYPSESVTLICNIDTYFPEYKTTLKYTSSRSDIVSVSDKGTILANAKGSALISVSVEITDYRGKTTTYFVGTVDVTVKDPFTTNSIYLMSYRGNGGKVEIPADRGITTIQSYAFSNYEYVEKDENDVIDEEDPYHIKQMYIGEDTITEVVIPDGVTSIESYAFAKLTQLRKVTFPKTLVRIGVGAFYGCNQLQDVNFENVKFINEHAFEECNITGTPKLSSIVAIGSYAFKDNKITMLNLPKSAQSLDTGAFQGNTKLDTVSFAAEQIKIGEEVFRGCTKLVKVKINAAVISDKAFFECSNLEEITLGKSVAVIGQNAFGKTKVSKFTVEEGNPTFTVKDNKRIYKTDSEGNEVLVLIAPFYGETSINLGTATKVESGAFAGNAYIQHVFGDNVTEIGSYAFADCINLLDFSFPNLTTIGDYAFYNAEKLTINSTAGDAENDQLKDVTSIGAFAFAGTAVENVNIAPHTEIGDFAFYWCLSLKNVKIGDEVKIGTAAFLNPVFDEYVEDLSHYTRYDYPVGDRNYTYYKYNFMDSVRSKMVSLEIGDGVEIGPNAFRNNAKLTSVTLGEGAVIGAYAFYDVTNLTSIDLSKATEIGVGAFSGTRQYDLYRPNPTTDPYTYAPAYEYETDEDGNVYLTGWYKTSDFAPSIISANLSSATLVGEGAFAFNRSLTEVTLNAGLDKIEAYAFAHCRSLAKVNYDADSETSVLPENVTKIGDYAFMNTKVVFKDLGNITEIGSYAFAHTLVKEITLNQSGTKIGDNAFYNCNELTTVVNMGSVTEIGEFAFALTALEKVDLSGVEKIGDFAFGGSNVKEVTFGKELKAVEGKTTKTLESNLKEIGENPFYGCEIESFALSEDVYYVIEGTEEKVLVGTKTVDTYDISETVKVIGNVLYAVVPNGLELICYPIGANASAYTVEENTVRIGARAFEASKLVNVTLPRSLKAIGDKAFYDCEALTTVIFNGYNAPVLEEEYDQYYSFLTTNLAGSYGGNEGLGISDYYMWTATNPTNFYYGANFVYNVGHSAPSLVIVSPANGIGYNTFIFKQYFGTSVSGSNAVTDETLAVIALIASLNNSITLKDEAAVEAARRAYDALPNLEQKALVTNYTKLTNAESMIIYWKQQGQVNPEPTVDPDPIKSSSVNALGIAGFTIAGVLLVALAILAVYTFLEKKKAKEAASAVNLDSSETVSEEGESAEAEEKNDASETDNNDNE